MLFRSHPPRYYRRAPAQREPLNKAPISTIENTTNSRLFVVELQIHLTVCCPFFVVVVDTLINSLLYYGGTLSVNYYLLLYINSDNL